MFEKVKVWTDWTDNSDKVKIGKGKEVFILFPEGRGKMTFIKQGKGKRITIEESAPLVYQVSINEGVFIRPVRELRGRSWKTISPLLHAIDSLGLQETVKADNPQKIWRALREIAKFVG